MLKRYTGYYSCTFANESCLNYGLLIKQRPSIPAPQRRITSVRIAGRDGEYVVDDEIYNSIDIEVQFNFMSETPNGWAEQYRIAKGWLRGHGDLVFSDDPDFFYKCQYVQITDSERTSRRIGNFTAVFHCDPYMYALSGLEEINPAEHGDKVVNPFLLSHPVYQITGTGDGTITVNGKTVSFTSPGKLTIDTDRMLAFNPDTGVITGTALTGYYTDLYLQPGENTVEISSGFGMTFVPGWRTI